jgi:hypothetical protein
MENLSDLGYPDYCITEAGRIYSLKSKRFLSTQYNDGGYEVVTLRKNGKTNTLKIHRLLCLTYKADTHFESAMVNHIDGNKKNNSLDNLEWCTRSENVLHAYDNGLIKNKPRQLSEDDVHLICQILESGARVIDVAKQFAVDRSLIYSIYSGNSYVYISFEYDFSRVPKNSRLSPEKVIKVCELLSKNIPQTEVAEITNVHLSSVKMIKQRRTHRYISDSYDW